MRGNPNANRQRYTQGAAPSDGEAWAGYAGSRAPQSAAYALPRSAGYTFRVPVQPPALADAVVAVQSLPWIPARSNEQLGRTW